MENNKTKKSVKFHGDLLNYCDFIQVFVFTSYHHLKGRFLKFRIYHNFASLFSKLSESTFYEEISKFQ